MPEMFWSSHPVENQVHTSTSRNMILLVSTSGSCHREGYLGSFFVQNLEASLKVHKEQYPKFIILTVLCEGAGLANPEMELRPIFQKKHGNGEQNFLDIFEGYC